MKLLNIIFLSLCFQSFLSFAQNSSISSYLLSNGFVVMKSDVTEMSLLTGQSMTDFLHNEKSKLQVGFLHGKTKPDFILENPHSQFAIIIESIIPNPCSQVCEAKIYLNEPGILNIRIFSNLGELVSESVQELFSEGRHSIIINTHDLSGGMYHLQFCFKKELISRKLFIIK